MVTRTRDWAEVDFYAVLGVRTDASEDDIARAYRALAKQLHPDSGATLAQIEQFKDVSSAYGVLGDARMRRDYDRVRSVPPVATTRGPAPAFRAPAPARAEFTRRWAWLAVLGGIVTIVAAVGVAYATLALRAGDADERAGTVAVAAVRSEVDGESYVTFSAAGERFTVPEPQRDEPGVIGDVVRVRYDPDDPQRVIADEDNFARDITLAIVAVKLLVGGVVFSVIGARKLRARDRGRATPAAR